MNHVDASSEQSFGPGSHLSSSLGELRRLTRTDRTEVAIASLLDLVDATEEDSLFTGRGVNPAYYEQLAMIFRARKEYAKEIAILARYTRQKHSQGDLRQEILKKRLEKAQRLFGKSTA